VHTRSCDTLASCHAPGVDTVAQMLYRVRDLSAGEMEVFMQSAPAVVSLPRTVREVSELLLGSHALTKRYLDDLHVHFEATRWLDDDGSALYDRTRMSWDVLVGTLVCKNRRLVNGSALLAATMAEDYGVAVTMRRADTGADAYGDDRALELEDARACAAPQEAVPFSDLDLDMDEARARAVQESLAGGCDSVALASLKTYRARANWGVAAAAVDHEFYERFVLGGDAVLQRLRR
jgi:hypothetical protein